ncbi:MAG: glycogen synthase [Erysipelotrichaceae bacterium]|nr:glycogen synthase [Erysipelotrichaceae bacterium]
MSESKKTEEKKTKSKTVKTKKSDSSAKAAEKKTIKKVVKKAKAEDVIAEVVVPADVAAAQAKPLKKEPEVKIEEAVKEIVEDLGPRRSVAFIGSECYPFVKTGGLADVMYALPKELVKQNCDVKVIIPRYKCIPWKFQEKMVYRGEYYMDLFADGKQFYVGIMEYEWDGVVYDFIDNEELFTSGNPYTNMVDDIPKFCYFSKAALSALLYLDWIPDVIHCHDWQAALTPIYLRTLFANTKLASSKTIMTVHNLRFQGIYSLDAIKYWSGLPDYVFNKDVLVQNYNDANMLKGGLAYADMISTVSNTYAGEIQSEFYGEGLDAHLRYHSGKLRGIVNGIDCEIWNPETDERIFKNYNTEDAIANKKANKVELQKELGLTVDENKFVIGLISRLTNQKGLDLVNAIVPQMVDGFTQLVVLGTGDPGYEDSFRYYENAYKGEVCSCIQYDEDRAHRIYASADALLVPSLFEPCGLTQLIAMRYGTAPIVRETGGLKDTVEPYNMYEDSGNGFTFDGYDAGLLLDAINRAKTLYFEHRESYDAMVIRDMEKDVSWKLSAAQYRQLYLQLKP